MSGFIQIGDKRVGVGHPIYIVAEMSANHGQSFEEAVRILHAAKEAGADALKLQTYTPDTITIACDNEYFRIKGGAPWDGKTLYELYGEAYTPWEWQPKLKAIADQIGLDLFSSPFDASAVNFLETMGVPAYKVASFEIVDLPLIEKMARTGKPLIISTGMSTLEEIEEAIAAARGAGSSQLAVLKCTSAYPARPEDMNLRTIPYLMERLGVPVGISDHTLGIAVPVAAVSLGACMIEKHFTLSRTHSGPDSSFSLEPHEFRAMVEAVRTAEKGLGEIQIKPSDQEAKNRVFRRSLFVVQDVRAGECFTEKNVRSIRPGYGLVPKFLPRVLGRRASQNLVRGTPLQWHHVT